MNPFIGVISDTHGQMRPDALDTLRGSELIIHAGDVGDAKILEQLAAIAPVHAVRGNVDYGELGKLLPDDAVVSWQGHHIYVLHILQELDLDPGAAGFSAVIYGHSHKPSISHKNEVLYLNPGSAGSRRFTLPISLARLTLDDDRLHAELIILEP